MNTTVVAVLKENEQELQSWLSAVPISVRNRLIIAETVVLELASSTASVGSSFMNFADDKGWAYNMVYFRTEADYWPHSNISVRYDHQGELATQTMRTPDASNIRQVLHQMITTEPNDPSIKDRLFHAYLLRFEWENQHDNGRTHLMRKLIGSL